MLHPSHTHYFFCMDQFLKRSFFLLVVIWGTRVDAATIETTWDLENQSVLNVLGGELDRTIKIRTVDRIGQTTTQAATAVIHVDSIDRMTMFRADLTDFWGNFHVKTGVCELTPWQDNSIYPLNFEIAPGAALKKMGGQTLMLRSIHQNAILGILDLTDIPHNSNQGYLSIPPNIRLNDPSGTMHGTIRFKLAIPDSDPNQNYAQLKITGDGNVNPALFSANTIKLIKDPDLILDPRRSPYLFTLISAAEGKIFPAIQEFIFPSPIVTD